MNDRAAVRRTPPHVYTALELAAMPTAEARAALVAQECAHMQQHHAARILKEIHVLDLRFDVGRVSCIGIDGQRFTWEAYEACGLCGDTGDLVGADSKLYACPECRDKCVEIFTTNYDGNDAKAVE